MEKVKPYFTSVIEGILMQMGLYCCLQENLELANKAVGQSGPTPPLAPIRHQFLYSVLGEWILLHLG